jgi:hypothetical protein
MFTTFLSTAYSNLAYRDDVFFENSSPTMPEASRRTSLWNGQPLCEKRAGGEARPCHSSSPQELSTDL